MRLNAALVFVDTFDKLLTVWSNLFSSAPNFARSLRIVFNAASMLSIAEVAPEAVDMEIWLIPVVDVVDVELDVVEDVLPSTTPSPSASAVVTCS